MIVHVLAGCQCNGKWCKWCDTTKCHGAFHADKRAPGRLRTKCIQCCKDYYKAMGEHSRAVRREYQQKNKARLQEHHLAYRQERREHLSARQRTYYQEHKAERIAYSTQYYQAHIEEVKAYKSNWRLRNKKHINAHNAAYRAANREKIAAQLRLASHTEHAKRRRKAYEASHRDLLVRQYNRRRAFELQAEGDFTDQQWADLKTFYGHKCLCCQRKEPEIKLTVDHIKPLVKGGSNWIENIQPLCQSCNSSKREKTIDYRGSKVMNVTNVIHSVTLWDVSA